MQRWHSLKYDTELYHWEPLANGEKTFEIRNNDRGFQVGDYLAIREWTSNGYTARVLYFRVTYIASSSRFLLPGYVVLGIKESEQFPCKDS